MFDDFCFVRLLGVKRDDGRPVAEHGNSIANREDFIEFVRDVDARDSTTPEIAQNIEQNENFVFCQSRGRLIQDQDVGIF